MEQKYDKATFGAGCFWHVEAEFRKLKGVMETAVGFMGGKIKDPSYERVCKGDTGHVEVVMITFDPQIIKYDELLNVFFSIHDPTQIDGQGLDIGSQYRSVIFVYNDQQQSSAMNFKNELSDSFEKKIVTTIEPASDFYKAEEYHQRYLEKKGLVSCAL